MRGSSSASPRIVANSSTENSASRMCSPGWSPARLPPSSAWPSPCPTPFPPVSCTKCGSSRWGIGIETTWPPCLPNSSVLPRCFFSSSRTLPRTICRKRFTSDSMRGMVAPALPFLDVAAGEDARHEVQHVVRARVAVAIIAHEAAAHDVDLLLRFLVHHGRDEARQLDEVLLVFE